MALRKMVQGLRSAIRYTRFPQHGDSEASPDNLLTETEVVVDKLQPLSLRRMVSTAKSDSLHPTVIALLVSLVLPFYFYVGPLRLSPNRIVLLLTIIPATLGWISGAAGRLRSADFLILGLCFWIAIAVTVVEGVKSFQFSGVTVVETLGAYLVGRVYIRSEAQYRMAMKILYVLILLLVPAAIIESLTGIRIYNRLFDPFMSTFPAVDYERRLNLLRAQTVFEHPILFGVFAAFPFAPIFTAAYARVGLWKAWILSSPVIIATFFSLSMGSYLGLMIQFMLMAWGLILHNIRWRWKLLGALVILAYLVVDIMSNRTPFQVLSSYVTFDAQTAFWRQLIFRYGIENVWDHPFFGLGPNGDWRRPDFMYSSSVDNFWLVFAMRYGIPGFLFILSSYLAVLIGLMRAKLTNPLLQRYRDALVFSLIGLGIAICTVHLWGATFIFMMFILGAGAWLSDVTSGVNRSALSSPAEPAEYHAGRRGERCQP